MGRTNRNIEGLEMTQAGQPYPYKDSIYAGTIEAENEENARDKLKRMKGESRPLQDKQDKENWHWPYLDEFEKVEDGKWRFKIIEAYTG